MSVIDYGGPTTPREIRKYLMRRTKDEIVDEYLHQWRYCGELEAERDAMKGALLDLVASSGGVYGLHLNGDPAPWEELLPGGRFEEWLLPFGEAPQG